MLSDDPQPSFPIPSQISIFDEEHPDEIPFKYAKKPTVQEVSLNWSDEIDLFLVQQAHHGRGLAGRAKAFRKLRE